MKTETVTTDKIISSLPEAPKGHSYEVVQESQMWWSIWLWHHADYDYACGRKVKTIYGFVKKNGGCHPAINSKKPRQREVLCQLVDLHKQQRYSMIVTETKSLLHLL